jgi:DNA-binding MarR family transcriptional regulator
VHIVPNPEATSEQVSLLVLDVLPRLMRFVVTSAGPGEPGLPLSVTQFRILKRLAGRPWLGGALAHELRITPPTVSATIDSLVRRGLVERGEPVDDRRAVPLRLTDAGARCFEDTQRRALTALRGIAEQMEPEDRSALARGIQSIATILNSQPRSNHCVRSLTIEEEV